MSARKLRIGLVGFAFVTLPLLGACGTQAAEDLLYDLCDQAGCQSDSGCPDEPPTAGQQCDLPDGSNCYYCRENDRYDAHHYECDGDRWERRANEDCS